MDAVERINSLYQEFINYHTRFSDPQYVLPDAKVEYLKQMARAAHQTLALCNPGRNDYHFLHLCCDDFNHLFTGIVTVESFLSAMHPEDLSHFKRAWEIGFQFMEKKNTDELNSYSLVFECRMLDKNRQYQRIMFKYLMVEEYDLHRYGQVLLFLKPIAGGKTDQPSHGIYIINIRNKEFIYSEKNCQISYREMEIVRYIRKGLISEEIAEKLNIKSNTVNNHRCNILRKLSVRDNGFAVMYLHDMGVI